MTPPRSLIGGFAQATVGHPWRRRVVVAVLVVLFALLALFPRQYRAAATMTPTDPGSAGLSGVLGQLGAFAGLLGQQSAIEINLKIARSQDVRGLVIDKMKLMDREGFSNRREADRWLEHKIDLRALRGGILQLETKDHDAAFARDLVGVYTQAIRTRLAQLTRQQTAYKRQVLVDLLGDANDRLARAQTAYDTFRRSTRYVQPTAALEAVGGRVPQLQQQLKGMEVQLEQARAFATDDNIAVRQIIAQMNVIRQQLREAEQIGRDGDLQSVESVVSQTTRVQKLQRELNIAQGLFDNYTRYLEGTSIEDLTSTANLRVLEPPFVDSAIEFNTIPLALSLLVLMLGLAAEFYLARPPVGGLREAA